ncbi:MULTISPECIES: GyrI-like domain-containing protein [Enterococcus]|uniref:GyrI-like domain-containing protein n=1 Tax=Enterococcus TaxID=1350 RepID=UPI001A921936|nr:GyrI-like domain-containing protein [Enterococcus ureilyticus]MBO0446738.1 GyrI-like domain-containing protein [Enterococcus ureilyticus]
MDITFTTIPPKKIIGLAITTCLEKDSEVTSQLWRNFINRKATIQNQLNQNSLSVKVTDTQFSFKDSKSSYQKWAAVEVFDFYNIEKPLASTTLAGGQYAVFTFKGPVQNFPTVFFKVINDSLPQSGYQIDLNREQFEVLDVNYHPYDINAQEEVWIPIK